MASKNCVLFNYKSNKDKNNEEKINLSRFIIGSNWWCSVFYPEYREIKQLERLVSAQQYYGDQQARKALEDFSPARLRVLAEKGNAVAQYQLGNYYFIKGQKNLATEWLLKASN